MFWAEMLHRSPATSTSSFRRVLVPLHAWYMLTVPQALEVVGFTQTMGPDASTVSLNAPAGWNADAGPLQVTRPVEGRIWYAFDYTR